jgi:hypothetical protein
MDTSLSLFQETRDGSQKGRYSVHQMPGLWEARSSAVPPGSEEASWDLSQEGIFFFLLFLFFGLSTYSFQYKYLRSEFVGFVYSVEFDSGFGVSFVFGVRSQSIK